VDAEVERADAAWSEDGAAAEGGELGHLPGAASAAPPAEATGGRTLGGLAARLEALLFSAAEPVALERLARAAGAETAAVRAALRELSEHLDGHGHAVALTELAGGFQLLTRPEYAPVVAAGGAHRLPPLSRAALEVLAIVAFWQPVTRAAVDELRGVHSEGALATLLERGLVTDAGRAEAPGRPRLYITTQRFLEYFGLKSLDELAAAEGMPDVPRPERARGGNGDRSSQAVPPAADPAPGR
jgi:segregation and condensation protein B